MGIKRSATALLALLATLALGLAAAGGASAAESLPHLKLEVRPAPTNLPVEGEGAIVLDIANLGDAPVKGEKAQPILIKDTLPAGIEPIKVEIPGSLIGGAPEHEKENSHELLPCSFTATTAECEFKAPLKPFEQLHLLVNVKTTFPAPTTALDRLQVTEGGGSGQVTQIEKELKISNAPVSFGIEGIEPGVSTESSGFEMVPENEKFEPETRAGSHPFQLTTTVNFNQTRGKNATTKEIFPTVPALPKTLTFKLPPGLLGNPTSIPQCTDSQFGVDEEFSLNACPEDTVVGVADVSFNNASTQSLEFATQAVPVYNLVPGPGQPARFGFEDFHVPVILNTSVRTGEDYGATITVANASDELQVTGTRVTIWGTPHDPRHDSARGWACLDAAFTTKLKEPACGANATHDEKAFLTMPTACGTQTTFGEGVAWEGARLPEAITKFSTSGCGELPFEPNLEVKTDEHMASTPTGMNVELSFNQEGLETEQGRAQADMRSFTLELPEGLTTSSGAANNLLSCGVQEVGFAGLDSDNGGTLGAELLAQRFSFLPPNERELGRESACPEAAKLGTVDIATPFLKHHVEGGVFLARQDTNPFAPRLVLYIVAEDPESNVLIKLAGEVEITPTGRLISRFKNSPQAAFEHLTLHLFNGSNGKETAAQATPSRCSTTAYSAHGVFGTWSEAEGEPEPIVERTTNPEGMAVTSGPHGTPCVEPGQALPFAPSLEAGSSNNEAGKFSPFNVTIARPDGNQALNSFNMTLPPGAAAKLASIEQCGEPAASEGNCGPGSYIGESKTYTGLGNAPYALPGKVYLTGPYHGAPFGLSTVTYANAVGPFNVGKIVVRSSISIDPYTAQASIDTAATRVYPSISPTEYSSTPEEFAGLPEILKGLPAQIKQVVVTVNRPEFEFNPTNCNPLSVNATLTGHEGGSATASMPFKVTNCGALPFQPKLTAAVKGQGSRVNGVTFKVNVESAGFGQANIHKVFLTLPLQLPSRLPTIQKACRDSIFNVNPATCPEGSNIGFATIHTPVLKNALTGPAYLVSHGGASFPDVEFVLQGENGLELILDGKTDIKGPKGEPCAQSKTSCVTFSRFESAPDAPFTKFETTLPEGPHSALGVYLPNENYNLCEAPKLTIPTEITAQNGTVLSQTTPVTKEGCKGVLPVTVHHLSRKQKLNKALAACRKKFKKNKKKRLACEKSARKKYGVKHTSKKKPSKKK